jgi:tRNA A-37 threonylcarbamoyl transferase component Bud32
LQIFITDASPIEVEAVVRLVPQQREVVRGVWQDKNGITHSVYAKKFLGNRAFKHFQRDLAGVNCLLAANIATPPLLFEGEVEQKNAAYVAIFSAIKDAKNAEEIWCNLSEEARFNLAYKLVQAVAQHHRAGLQQTDLYLKNFLVANDVIYSLDGDGIRPLPAMFRRYQQLKNLATLFSKMDVLEDVWIERLYKTYCQETGIDFALSCALNVQYLTEQIRYQVTSRYADKKVFRSCTDVKVTQNFRCFEAIAADFGLACPDLSSLDQFLLKAELNIKNGRTCTISMALLASKQVIIKRYNIKHFWHGVNRAFRSSRAAKSWANAHRLIISNIATAKPLALVEERFGCLRRRAYYLSEYIDAPDVMQFFAQVAQLDDKRNAARNLAILFYKMYLLKFSHGDCKATNIKIVNLAPVLIDLDAMQVYFGGIFSDWWFERKHIKDLKRLMKNWENDTEMTALLKQAFMLEYAAVSPNVHHGILFRAGIT